MNLYLEITLALAITSSIIPGVSPRNNSIYFNPCNLLSLACVSLLILTIVISREKGIDLKQSMGWQIDVKRFWFLTGGFLNKLVIIFTSLMWHRVSKYEINFERGHEHDSKSELSFLGLNGSLWIYLLGVLCSVHQKIYGAYAKEKKKYII